MAHLVLGWELGHGIGQITPLRMLAQAFCPGDEPGLHRYRVQPAKHPAKRVVRWNAVGQIVNQGIPI